MNPWIVISRDTKKLLSQRSYSTAEEAQRDLCRLGPVLAELYRPWWTGSDPKLSKMLNEGLTRNDLEGILLPKMSVDEYIPSDPNTDNVVLAFFIKNVPEAVIPFKNFAEKCNGVIDVDYGDSETIPNTSIVYIEMDRAKMRFEHIRDIILQAGMLSGLKPADFTMTFPNTNKKFPFSRNVLRAYFKSRNHQQNVIAQRQAERQAEKEIEKALQTSSDKVQAAQANKQTADANTPQAPEEAPQAPEPQPQQAPQAPAQPAPAQSASAPLLQSQPQAQESMVSRLVDLLFESP